MIVVIIVFVFINIPNSVSAQTQRNGFFIGGSLTGLLMDGKGVGLFGSDFETTNDILTITFDEEHNEITSSLDGWSWKNNLLYGFKPYIGFRFSSKFALLCSYSFYLNKEGKYSRFFPKSQRFLEVEADVDININTKYTQNTIQILGQLYPARWESLFISAGIEFVSMDAEMNSITILGEPGHGNEATKINGNDNAIGSVFGGGIETPLISQNISFVATAFYSLTKYKGKKLLDFESVISDPEIHPALFNLALNVGGFIGNIGLKWYF